MRSASVPAETLRGIIKSLDGRLVWGEMPASIIPGQRARRRWNTLYSGKPVPLHQHNQGYLTISFAGRCFLAHRVIWALETGAWPEGHIDHLNGVRTDNRIENLRVVSGFENMRNQKLRSDNASGHVGVCFDKGRRDWRATILGRAIGRFPTREQAIRARLSAQEGHGFTPRHGQRA